MMYDLTGYMVINGKDAWTEYSAFLCEDRPEDSTNVTELLKPPEMKISGSVTVRNCRSSSRFHAASPATLHCIWLYTPLHFPDVRQGGLP